MQGSDHCPVFAVFKDRIPLDDAEVCIHDIMNPPGMFDNGTRQREYSTKDLLPLSGRLIPEFDRRRNIRDMFSRKPSSFSENDNTLLPSLVVSDSNVTTISESASMENLEPSQSLSNSQSSLPQPTPEKPSDTPVNDTPKRSRKESVPAPPPKRSKSSSKLDSSTPRKGQQSLTGFFKPKKPNETQDLKDTQEVSDQPLQSAFKSTLAKTISPVAVSSQSNSSQISQPSSQDVVDATTKQATAEETIIDPIVSKESWMKLFTKKGTPKCEEHHEPCIMYTTKKPGINCGRSFWICSRPLGPTGQKERGTQWRCKTFIWASDWNGQE